MTVQAPPATRHDVHNEPGAGDARPIPGLAGDRTLLWPLLGGALVLVCALGLGVLFGSVVIPIDHLLGILASRLPGVGLEARWPASSETILLQLRLPRVLLAALVGAVLGIAGATYQGVFRNPLADPYLIGVAGGAGLGATIAIVSPLAVSFYGFSALPAFAFAGALAAVSCAYLLARSGRAVPAASLILAGVAIASLTSAVTSFLMMTSGERIQTIFAWLLGGFSVANWNQLILVLPYALPAAGVLLLAGRALDVLQVDEDQARQLGMRVERTKVVLLGAASLATAAAVAVSGLIGFVGLIVPHVVRLIVGPSYRLLLSLSALTGAAFMVLSDLVARTILGSVEVPVGIVTAFCGAPFFLWLLRTRRAVS